MWKVTEPAGDLRHQRTLSSLSLRLAYALAPRIVDSGLHPGTSSGLLLFLSLSQSLKVDTRTSRSHLSPGPNKHADSVPPTGMDFPKDEEDIRVSLCV